jgi:hypothetical protein
MKLALRREKVLSKFARGSELRLPPLLSRIQSIHHVEFDDGHTGSVHGPRRAQGGDDLGVELAALRA